LRDGDDDPGIYIAALGSSNGWRGAVVYKAPDQQFNWVSLLPVTKRVVAGTALTVLGNHGHETWDRINTVRVRLVDGTLASATELAVLNGANAAVLGSEVIQWQTATQISAQEYDLSLLLRGRKGSEWATTPHQIGDRFVLIDISTWRRYDGPAEDLNKVRYYKGVTIGQHIDDAPLIAFVNSGVGQKPYAPVHLRGARAGNNDLTVSWTRRTRVAGEWLDYINAPLGESSESYEIDILDGIVVKRTLTSSAPSVLYTAAQQTTDFGSPQASVSVKVYQKNALIGRGYAGSATV